MHPVVGFDLPGRRSPTSVQGNPHLHATCGMGGSHAVYAFQTTKARIRAPGRCHWPSGYGAAFPC